MGRGGAGVEDMVYKQGFQGDRVHSETTDSEINTIGKQIHRLG